MLRPIDPERQRSIISRELLIALAVLLAFTLFGRCFLTLLHIEQPAVLLAGGMILFLMALRMVMPPPALATELPQEREEPLIGSPSHPPRCGPLHLGSARGLRRPNTFANAPWSCSRSVAHRSHHFTPLFLSPTPTGNPRP